MLSLYLHLTARFPFVVTSQCGLSTIISGGFCWKKAESIENIVFVAERTQKKAFGGSVRLMP
jgi:hypothetical protein